MYFNVALLDFVFHLPVLALCLFSELLVSKSC